MMWLWIPGGMAIFLAYVGLVCWLFGEYGRALDRERGK